MSSPSTVFLDRDGCLNHDPGYLFRPAEMHILAGAGGALGELKRSGFSLVIVSNQSAVGRGLCERGDVLATNAEMERQLLAEDTDAKFDRIYFCPHRPNDGCRCRKPGTDLITNAESGWPFDLKTSWMVGDRLGDIEFGLGLGLPPERCILVLSGHGAEEKAQVFEKHSERISLAADIISAARMIAQSARS